jgi:4-hydroxybenzoate polyprenyltransferase
MLGLGRLLRLSLAPSALADVAAGAALVATDWPSGGVITAGLISSACVYHGGMALNDWADRAADARDGRPRPIPTGQVRAATALALSVLLLVLGPALMTLVVPRAALLLAGVALVAAIYDLFARGPWLGPVLLGACRTGNLTFGMFLALEHEGRALPLSAMVVAAGYGLYVFSLSRLARLEDRPAHEIQAARPDLWLGLAALVLALQGVLAGSLLGRSPGGTTGIALALAAWGAITLLRQRPRGGPWQPPDAGRVAGAGLRRLLVATAAIALQGAVPNAPLVAVAILAGYPLSYGLRRVFPPT